MMTMQDAPHGYPKTQVSKDTERAKQRKRYGRMVIAFSTMSGVITSFGAAWLSYSIVAEVYTKRAAMTAAMIAATVTSAVISYGLARYYEPK